MVWKKFAFEGHFYRQSNLFNLNASESVFIQLWTDFSGKDNIFPNEIQLYRLKPIPERTVSLYEHRNWIFYILS